MKVLFLLYVFLLSSTAVIAQQLPEWYRVYTLDESKIDMNTSLVTFGGKDTGRVRFRWTFDKPEALSGEPRLKYKSLLEVIEFKCSDNRYRPYETEWFDSAGKVVHSEVMNPPREWLQVTSGMGERLFDSACKLIKRKTQPTVAQRDSIELTKVAKYAYRFSQRLEHTKDFKPVIEDFFAVDYLNGYLHDTKINWFMNLERETAAKASRAELQRFYVASLNTGYLSCLYLISQYRYASDRSIPEEKLIPPDIIELIDNHPYTASYKGKQVKYDYLAERIDSVERLRSYTDLLENIGRMMRKHVIRVGAERSREYQAILDSWELYQPKVKTCADDCLGLPEGTRLFEVNVPIFQLQLAEIKGVLRVVSATDYFH
jgi:hypothetical protein